MTIYNYCFSTATMVTQGASMIHCIHIACFVTRKVMFSYLAATNTNLNLASFSHRKRITLYSSSWNKILAKCFSNPFYSRKPLGFEKQPRIPHIFSHVNIECSDDRYPKLKMYISELILDSYEYISHECGSLSTRHGASSGCGWRNGLTYGG